MELHDYYLSIKPQIDDRLAEFEAAKNKDDQILKEFVFCQLTPQTDAHKAWRAVEKLWSNPERKTSYFVSKTLRSSGVRFHNAKTERVLNTFRTYPDALHLKSMLRSAQGTFKTVREMRNFFAELISGYGMKEASHFLRNIGYGNDICILDRHILRKLKENKVIREIPKLNKKKYLEIEEKMIAFAERKEIPIAALDLVFWHQAKRELFK